MLNEHGKSQITVLKANLLEKIKENRAKHAATVLLANQKYREATINKLTSMLQDASSGKAIRNSTCLKPPEDYTNNYDVVIEMLEMTISSEIQISESQFRQYVRDEWDWKHQWEVTTASYIGG